MIASIEVLTLCLILEVLGEIDLVTADPKRMRGETDLLTDPERFRPNLSGEIDLFPVTLLNMLVEFIFYILITYKKQFTIRSPKR